MKKWLSLLLAMTLLMTAAFALAESAETEPAPTNAEAAPAEADQPISYYSNVPFGADLHTAAEKFKTDWAVSDYIFGDPAVETKTLADGTQYIEQTFTTGEGSPNQMTGKLFYLNGAVIAGIEEMALPEGFGATGLTTRIKQYLGEPIPFTTDAMGSLAEMIGEAAHADAVKDLWQYRKKIVLSGTEQAADVNAYITLVVIDGRAYMAEWFKQPVQSSPKQAAQELKDIEKLTPEERNAFDTYAEFLEQQKNAQLQQYVDFLLKKRK